MSRGGKLGPAIIAWLRQQPSGSKPHMGDMRKAIQAEVGHAVSPGQLSIAVQALRLAGKLHWERMELSPSMLIEAAPSPPTEGDPPDPIGATAVHGEVLVARLRAYATSSGRSLKTMLAPVTKHPDTWLNQLAAARRPTRKTVERVEALLRGEELPQKERKAVPASALPITRAEREARGLPPSGRMARDDRSLTLTAEERRHEDERRRESFRAHEVRRPGESVADAVRRTAEVASLRAELAGVSAATKGNAIADGIRALGAEVDAELALDEDRRRDVELDRLASPSSLLRRAQRDWPVQCSAVKALASEMGVGLAEAWHRVIKAGLDCLVESEEPAHG